jgi:hypothetical protein
LLVGVPGARARATQALVILPPGDYDAFVYNVMSGYAHGGAYLGGRSPLAVSREALDQAIAQLRSKQGTDPSKWRAPMPMIDFQSLDVAGVPSIPWENRGTWGQAVELPPAG